MDTNGKGPATGQSNEPLFDAARLVDREWMELSLTTPDGDKAYFRVPRRTLFAGIDSTEVRQNQ